MENRADRRKSIAMNVASMLIFGTIGIFRKRIPISSAALAFTRGILGSLFLLAFLRLRKAKEKKAEEKLPGRTVLLLAVSGAVMGVNWMLLFEAYHYTTVAVATLCYYMQPTIVMLLSPVLFGERLTVKKAACAAVAVAGMALVSGAAGGGGAGEIRGILLGLGAAVFYAAVIIMNKRIRGVDAYRKTTVQLLSAGAAMIPYLLLTGGFSGTGINGTTVLLLLTVGIVHTGIAYVLYFGSMEGLKAQTVAFFSYIDPVSAMVFSALFPGEPMNASGIAGAAMIIGSAVICELQRDQAR